MRKTADFLLDMLYPKKCPMCHEVLKDKKLLICERCAGRIRPISGALCMKCGKPVKMEEEYCPVCRNGNRYFSEGRSIFPYGELWRQSLVRFKYYGCREYGDFYAKAMSVYGRKYLERWKPQLLVPVPLHPSKKRMRGFNQSAYLAEKLSVFTGTPWDDSLVIKIRRTRSQKKLDAVQRRNNLRKAYRVSRKLSDVTVLVVDDVYTTGSTMEAMAMCLLEAGARDVYFLTVCAGRL
ncbi:double zinc ribbon domain-containing protein [Blautia sp. CLA-JM-H16]|uniref:Double zinc ribbon domain-containing protein n=1 Tax=Blautia aquisgranensis TaxID=3133153 RepID=A0ABV1BI03_9FIRM